MPHRFRAHPMRRGLLAVSGALVIAATLPLSAGAAPPSGFLTSQDSMLLEGLDAPAGTTITPLITVGDTLGDYMFEAIPDGIAVKNAGKGGAQVYVNHETSTVPFPYSQNVYPIAPTTSNSFNDYRNSELSKLMLRQNKAGEYRIVDAEMVIDASAGYHRFCSNYLASTDGFENRPMVFTNEEGIDWVYETVDGSGLGWTSGVNLEGAPGARQIGAVVAYDLNSKTHKPIWGMGRHNHENTVAIPGYGYPVLLSGDDAFNQNLPQSQVYAYIADDADGVWNDTGDLWAFAPDAEFESINDYYDFAVGSTMSISGHFVQVPKNIATGKDEFGVDLRSSDVGYPAPPDDATWQRPPGSPITPTPAITGVDGPQWILEHWGDPVDEEEEEYGNNVFQFLRIEDIAFDKREGMQNVVYLVDSGRGLRPTDSLGLAPWRSTNGRVWKMVLDPEDPTTVLSLSILIEGDDSPVKTLREIHQPDNIESTLNGLLITEDPGSSQQFSAAQQASDPTNATTARLMYYDFGTGDVTAVLKVSQAADEGPTDEDTSSTAGNWGAWETSGIVDVSSIFGADTFLINVQAHTLFVDIDNTSAPDNLAPTGDDWQFKREGGQLLLVKLPGV